MVPISVARHVLGSLGCVSTKALAFRSSPELIRIEESDMMFPDQIPSLRGPELRLVRFVYGTPREGSS